MKAQILLRKMLNLDLKRGNFAEILYREQLEAYLQMSSIPRLPSGSSFPRRQNTTGLAYEEDEPERL